MAARILQERQSAGIPSAEMQSRRILQERQSLEMQSRRRNASEAALTPAKPQLKKAKRTLPCSICADDKLETAFPDLCDIPRPCRPHFFHDVKFDSIEGTASICKSCIGNYFAAALDPDGRGVDQLGCMTRSCYYREWDPMYIFKFLTNAQKLAFSDQKFKIYVNRHGIISCPFDGCNGPDGIAVKYAPGFPNVQCYTCKKKFCASCRIAWHEGETCQECRNRVGVNEEEKKTLMKLGKEGYRRCPRCQYAIQRTQGCNHMHCTNCSTYFDYSQGEKVGYIMKRDVPTRSAAAVAKSKIREQFGKPRPYNLPLEECEADRFAKLEKTRAEETAKVDAGSAPANASKAVAASSAT